MKYSKFFTKEGNKALITRLENLSKIYANLDQRYPFTLRMLGFPPLEVASRDEMYYRVKELSDLLGVVVEVSTETKIIMTGDD